MIALQRQRLQEKTSRTFSDVLWGCSQKVWRPGWQEPGLALAKARRANLIFTSMYCQKYNKNWDSRKQITPHSLRTKSETCSALVTKGREHREKALHPNCCAHHNEGDSLADFINALRHDCEGDLGAEQGEGDEGIPHSTSWPKAGFAEGTPHNMAASSTLLRGLA